jgi:nicotinate-nucleotide--dimethylbenzimidazole phosphoribosyltransferase
MQLTSSTELQQKLQQLINNKTKPLGALGRLEELALQIGMIQQTERPAILEPHIIVFAGDHGIAKTGRVNAYPQEVTAQMVLNFLQGGAAINVFCRQHQLALKVVDAGVNFDFLGDVGQAEKSAGGEVFIHAKIDYGTNDYLQGPAMTNGQAEQAIEKGREIVAQTAAAGCNCIGFGEMGIGNTSSATLIMSAITGLPVAQCTGRGAGLTDEQLHKKISALQEAYQAHGLSHLMHKPVELLAAVGGFEIAMMVGAYLEAVRLRMIVIVDGFIASAALLVANELSGTPLAQHCIFAHTSHETGHEKILNHLHAQPLLNLGMRLGEGTGAALAMPLIRSAVQFLNEMASFESAGVSKKD